MKNDDVKFPWNQKSPKWAQFYSGTLTAVIHFAILALQYSKPKVSSILAAINARKMLDSPAKTINFRL